MAAGDLADLRSRVIARGSFNSSDAGLTAAAHNTHINAALKQIAAERDWPWLYTSETIAAVSGTAVYTPAAGWVRTDSLAHADTGESLAERQIQEIDRISGAMAGSTSRPWAFALYGDQIVLGPVPAAVLSIRHRYVRAEPVLVADGDLPLLPRAFDEGAVEWAVQLGHAFTRQFDKAEAAAARYNAWLKTVQDSVRRARRPLRVQVRPGSPL